MFQPSRTSETTMDSLFDRIVASGVLRDIEAQGAAEYPSEACGVLVEDADGIVAVPFENMQDKLHAIDPERFTRTSRTAYNLNSLKLERIRSERNVCVIYHSHVECDAYFSDEDQAGAVTPDTSEPVIPGVDYLVISIYDRKAREANLYRYSSQSKRYEHVDGTEIEA
ncbi:MAG: hypothetical protein CMH54_09195 [Myxococcales bacterium]|nr:hypothetical protein [Myxococcales bacterium]|tara:strand:- start:1485 stop:1988 length:504 start_codon:yes stop_codon:yes gene_type:complete